jgi:hypothetical protein
MWKVLVLTSGSAGAALDTDANPRMEEALKAGRAAVKRRDVLRRADMVEWSCYTESLTVRSKGCLIVRIALSSIVP